MPYGSLTLEEFCARVQTREPTPGGGSVSAVAAAMGASLGAMAAAFSTGKEGAPEVEALRAEMQEVAAGFLRLADDDSRAYERFAAAQKLPKGSDAEKQARKAAMQEALRGAAEVPLEGMRRAHRLLELLERLRPRCNPHLASDVAVGGLLARAALHGCRLNVQVNLVSLHDAEFVGRVGAEAARCAGEGDALAARLLAALEAPR